MRPLPSRKGWIRSKSLCTLARHSGNAIVLGSRRWFTSVTQSIIRWSISGNGGGVIPSGNGAMSCCRQLPGVSAGVACG